MRKKKLFIFVQLFLLLGAGIFSINYFTQSSIAGGCSIYTDTNGSETWDCPNHKVQQFLLQGTAAGQGYMDIAPYGDVAPTALQVGTTYRFDSKVTTKTNPGSDQYDITVAQILDSPTGTPIDTVGPHAVDMTLNQLSSNRSKNNDTQQAVDENGNNIAGGLSWASYACGNSRVDFNGKVNGTQEFSCLFTPSKTGYFQVDTNSLNFFNQSGDCVHGYCGPLAAFIVKVLPAPPTPSLECGKLTVTDQATGITYSTSNAPISQDIAPLQVNGQPTNEQRSMVLDVSGTTNQTPIGIKWRIRGLEANNGVEWNQDTSIKTITPASGSYDASDQFTFGPFSDSSGSNSNIQALDNFSFSVIPIFYVMQNGSFHQFNTDTLGVCNAGLTTKSAPTVIPGSTSAQITVTKTLVTSEPIPVGDEATFKVVITDTGKDPIKDLKFQDFYQNNDVVDFVSGSGFETLAGVNSATEDLGLSGTAGSTNQIDLTNLFGGKEMNTGDSFTLMLTFLGKQAGTNIDTAVGNGTSVTGIPVNGSDQASVTFSPSPVSPNTGAETPVTLAAIFVFALGVAGKKYALKLLAL